MNRCTNAAAPSHTREGLNSLTLIVQHMWVGLLQTQRPQRDGRAHVHPAADVQEDQAAGRSAAEVRHGPDL